MSRNTSGNYALAAGNPVLTGTTVSSTWVNNTLNDIGLEITNSLDRQGRGGMVAQLKSVDGTKPAPQYSFTSEPGSGLYRAGAGDVRLAVLATDALKATNTTLTFSVPATAAGTLTSTGAFTASNTSHLVGAVTADGAVEVKGALTADVTADLKGAVTAEAPLTALQGIDVTGPAGGPAVAARAPAASNQAGGDFTGNGTAPGLQGTGGATNAPGLKGVGKAGGTGAGLEAQNGTAATGATRQNAIRATNGDISLAGVANPDSTTAISNAVTPKNVCKAWALIKTTGVSGTSATVQVLDGFNIASASSPNAQAIGVAWATNFASANYGVMCQSDDQSALLPSPVYGSLAIGSCQVNFSGAGSIWTNGVVHYFVVVALGAQ